MIRDRERAKGPRNIARAVVFAFMNLVVGVFTIYEDGIFVKQRVRLFGRARMEQSKGVFQLTNAITHAGNPTVQVFRSGNDEAIGKNDRSPVSFGNPIDCMVGRGRVVRMIRTGSPVLWQGCLINQKDTFQHCGHRTKKREQKTDRSDTKRHTLSAMWCGQREFSRGERHIAWHIPGMIDRGFACHT